MAAYVKRLRNLFDLDNPDDCIIDQQIDKDVLRLMDDHDRLRAREAALIEAGDELAEVAGRSSVLSSVHTMQARLRWARVRDA